MNTDQNELFLTLVDAGGGKVVGAPSIQLAQVRHDHTKIQEVVEAFQIKVDRMVDKQRQEYVSAYEHHIQDVQKELHLLREKAHEIANDQTKNERTEKLKADLNRYKSEALQLETDSDELRLTMASLVRRVYSVERYRDWMLKKLRHAKRQYNALVKERARLMPDDHCSLSNASSYTLEFQAADPDSERPARSASTKTGVQTRLPSIPLPLQPKDVRSPYQGSAVNCNPLADLLAARARQDDLLNFLESCLESLHRRPFVKIVKRPLAEVFDFMQAEGADEAQMLSLACELAATPQVYQTLLTTVRAHRQQLTGNSSPDGRRQPFSSAWTDELVQEESRRPLGLTLEVDLDDFMPKF